jgi:RNA polymerase sigma factor (sigma-70 family)
VSSGSRQTMDGGSGFRVALSRAALRLQSDRRLVALARDGSDGAFATIVERYRPPLLRYCGRLLGQDESEDAVQQAFTNALPALRTDDRPIELSPWLYRIAHNVSVNSLRRSGRDYEPLSDQLDGVPQPPDVLDEKERIARVFTAIDELPVRQRKAMVARELEGRSYEEIALRMDEATPVVRQLIHRARTRLRDGCGVLVPAWALRWLLFAGPGTGGSERVGEVLAGGGAGASLVKAATVVLATGAIATGAGGLTGNGDHAPWKSQAANEARRDALPKARDVVADAHPPSSAASKREGAALRAPVDSAAVSNGAARGLKQQGETGRNQRTDGPLHGAGPSHPQDANRSGPDEGSTETPIAASHQEPGSDHVEGSGGGADSAGASHSGPSGSSDTPDAEASGSPDSGPGPSLLP